MDRVADLINALQQAVSNGWLTDAEAKAEACRCFPSCERVDSARRILTEAEGK